MKVVDMHCDTISEIHYAEQEGHPAMLASNNLHIDLEKMRRGDYLLQNFAMFVHQNKETDPLTNVLELIDIFYREMEKNRDAIGVVYRYDDILENEKAGKLSALLTMEEGAPCKGDPAVLRMLYRLGVRMLTLTWNFENELGWPNNVAELEGYDPAKKYGLKERGIEFVAEMERLGMIVDVSHLSDDGFYDVCEHATRPFVASHSNARALCDHTRNLTDDMIRKLADHGGVTGINYCCQFLEPIGPEGKRSRIERMAAHISHIMQVGGTACVGLGSDFDGITGNLELYDASALPLLEQDLRRRGFHEREIEGVFYQNVLNLYKEVLR